MLRDTRISTQINALANALVADFGDEDGDLPAAIWWMHGDIGSAHIMATEAESARDDGMRAMALVFLHHAQRIDHNARSIMARASRRAAA
ncbi:hypothetical protein [Rhodovarius lipocyclicus]|uniref:hypothetical protein n=1 Tax=Rhodovarius lipocyclicus TaxID=268410 RepID=UPI001356CD52|nr:hypothetical protein [Rhodovarius lipocyclicus]